MLVQSLVRELRSYMMHGAAKKKKKNNFSGLHSIPFYFCFLCVVLLWLGGYKKSDKLISGNGLGYLLRKHVWNGFQTF